jgi:dihydroorotase
MVGYLLVRDDVIVEIGEGAFAGDLPADTRVVDACGRIVMPGAIDCHVHFREPGLTAKGDMASESAAAVAGGVTSVIEMPNTVPQTVSREALERKFALAEGRMHTNYSFFVGATNDNLQEILKIHSEGGFGSSSGGFGGACGVKLFMGSSTGGMLVEDDYTLSKLFAEYDGVISAHCEDETIIRTNTDIYRAQSGDKATAARSGDKTTVIPPIATAAATAAISNASSSAAAATAAAAAASAFAAIHPLVRSEEACYRATARAVELADRYGARLHVAHLTTARELALFDSQPLFYASPSADVNQLSLKKITAEACVPHLWFTEADYARLGNRIKCNPAIKTAADRDALRRALGATQAGGANGFAGKIDLVATDHAPHTAEEKSRGYWDAPSGIPSVGHSVAAMFELVAQGELTLETLVEKMCHAPAVRFGIADRGFLRPGYKADIAIVDPAAKDPVTGESGWTVAPENILYKCGWSPWEGARLTARVEMTVVGGRVAWDGSQISETAKGRPLEFRK